MQQVLIEFTSDASGLAPAEKALNGLTDSEKKLADQAAKSSAVINQRNKEILQLEKQLQDSNEKSAETIANLKKQIEELKKAQQSNANQALGDNKKVTDSIDKMAAASKTLDKVVVGANYKKVLQDMAKQYDLTGKQVRKFYDDLAKNAKIQLLDPDLSAEDRENLQALMKAAEELSDIVQPLRSKIIDLKDELNAMAAAGLKGTPAYEALKNELVELQKESNNTNAELKKLGSENRNIDGLISLARGLAGGFELAEGAMALFGDESEDMHKTLVRLNAAMAILQGLQEIQEVLSKESAANVFLSNLFKKQQVATTAAHTVALEAEVVATAEATVAQTELNTAMSLNPAGIVLLAITTLIAAYVTFSHETETAAEKTERLTKEADHLFEALQKIRNLSQSGINRQIAITQNEEQVKLLSAQEAGVVAINGLKKEGLRLQRQDLDLQLFNVEAAKSIAEDKSQFLEQEFDIKKQIYQNSQQQLLLDIETNKVLAERALKSNTGFADADLLNRKIAIVQNQVDTIKSIEAVTDAEITAIKAKKAEELHNAQLTAGERERINQAANLRIAELRKDQERKMLEIEKAGINANVILAKKGSEDEYNLKIKLLEQQQKIELQQTELTEEQIAEIKANYRAKELELERQFQEQIIQDEISFLNSYIDAFGISEERKLELTLRRLNRQRDLEISQAQENAAKIKEINSKFDAEIIESKKAAIQKITALQQETFRTFTAIGDADYQRTLSNDRSSVKSKINAVNQILDHQIKVIGVEREALEKQKKQNLITQEEYSLRSQEIINKKKDAEIAAEKKITEITVAENERRVEILKGVMTVFATGLSATLGSSGLSAALQEIGNFAIKANEVFDQIKAGTISTIEGIKALAETAVASAQAVVNQIFAGAAAERAQIAADEIAALEESKQRELSVKNLTEQQKADIEARYRQQERRIKIEAFNADKEAKKMQAQINGALAATLALAEYPWPYSLIVAGLLEGLTQIEVAEINRQQPRFKTGVVDFRGKGTSTSDENQVWISDRESIINARATAKWKDALLAINNDNFEGYVAKKLIPSFYPEIPETVYQLTGGPTIDYKLLAQAIAEVMPDPLQVHNNIDDDGLHSFVQKGNSRTEILNKRYSMDNL